jgi:hypothetical protein
VTVVGMLEELAVPAGEYLLQTAAGSVLGRQMIQVGRSFTPALPAAATLVYSACPAALQGSRRRRRRAAARCTVPSLSIRRCAHSRPTRAASCAQVAKHRGIKTINVVRRQELVAELKALG